MPKRPDPSGTNDLCPHCHRAVSWKHVLDPLPVVSPADFTGEYPDRQTIDPMLCPGCGKFVVDLVLEHGEETGFSSPLWGEAARARIYPEHGGLRPRLDSELIPRQFRELYNEAVDIEALSLRGACGLLRTALEAILLHRGHQGRNLEAKIDAARVAEKTWPADLLSKLHLVRLLGNIGDHWDIDASGNVTAIDAAELEAMFGAVEQMLQVVFVGPLTAAAEIERLNTKLEAAGKPMRLSKDGAIVDKDGNPWQPKKLKAVPEKAS